MRVIVCLSISLSVCVFVRVWRRGRVHWPVFICMGEKVLTHRIRYRDYSIWTTHQGTEFRVTNFPSQIYYVSSLVNHIMAPGCSTSKSKECVVNYTKRYISFQFLNCCFFTVLGLEIVIEWIDLTSVIYLLLRWPS